MGILKSFDIKRLRPFRKNGGRLPGPAAEDERLKMLDPDLRPEEQSYVRHFLGFADVLLGREREQEQTNVVEMRRKEDIKPSQPEGSQDSPDKAA
jgi:hypothetical protein